MQDAVPIITANFGPLRFVLRDEVDQWAPTLEQINGRDYDYVKLHRMSTYFDVGIAPYSLGVCFDGTLVLPALPQYQDRTHALARFNQTLTELLIGGVYCEAVTPDDVGYGSLSFTAYAKIHGGGSGPSASFHRAARSKHIGTLDVISLLKPETVTTKELHESLASGRNLLERLGDIPQEQVLYGTTFYVRKQWAESLIHIWTTIERIVELAWQKHVVSSVDAPTKKRRAFLDDHRTWPVSAKLEVLFQKSLLRAGTLDTLDKVRKARNDFAHRGVLPTHELATKALTGCFELVSLCASNFARTDLFERVVSLVVGRCDPDLFPRKTTYADAEVSHWLALPPLPGDKEWGDQTYE
ncbi:MAG: hypothetical protein ACRD2L_26120, partial [Terriglobia bacterium]